MRRLLSRTKLTVLMTLATVVLLPLAARAQSSEASSRRGFQPGNSYSSSEFETINTTNGNLILNFGLGSLAPGRGGLTASMGVRYNSKLYDSDIQVLSDSNNQLTPQSYLVQTDVGGWQRTSSLDYSIKIVNRADVEGGPYECTGDGGLQNKRASYVWKLKVIYPDGAEREFRPAGHGDILVDGYFNVNPYTGELRDVLANGQSCTEGAYGTAANPLTYFSTDGTYTRLVITRGDNWTLSFTDGSRVVGSANGGFGNAQYFYDRNNNYITYGSVTLPNGHPVVGIVDQFGHYVAMESNQAAREDYYYSLGYNNQSLMWTVKWKSIAVFKPYETSPVGGGRSRGTTSLQTYQGSFDVIERITLPSQAGSLSYQFGYNAVDEDPNQPLSTNTNGWGEVSGITLPTGAQVAYEYSRDSTQPVDPAHPIRPKTRLVLDNSISRKTVTYQDVFENNSNAVTETWSYGITRFGSTVIGPDGGMTSQTHYDTASGLPNAGLVSFEQYPNGETVERTWQNNQPSTTTGFLTNQSANFYVKREFRSIPNAAGTAMVWTAIKDYDYDKNGNVTRMAQYDWVPYDSVHANGAAFLPGNLIPTRVTTTAYYNATLSADNYTTEQPNAYWNPAAPNIRGLAAATEVQGRVGQSLIVVARSEFVYDNPGTTGNPTCLTNWDSSKGPLNSSAPVLTSSNSISVLMEYNQYGSPTLITDARGFFTHITYGNVGGYTDLYPTMTQSAYGSAVQRTEAREYDPSSGLLKRITDNDNNVSSSTVYDAFGRPTLVTAAEGTAAEARSSTEYSDGERRVIVRSDVNDPGDGRLVTIQHYDQLGRVRLTQQLEDAATENAYLESSGIKVQTRYLVAGSNSYQLVSSPYRASSVSGAGSEATMSWTRTSSDNAGRVQEVQTFGGAGLPAPWGSNTSSSGAAVTAIDANTVVVTDQSGRQRKSVSDGLGRLIQVYEDPAGVNYLTSYSYDARDDLVGVNQGSQSRTFVYDSLKRLTAATNPESGTINYDYDENGNLRHKTDARMLGDNSDHVRISYDYDELNRLRVRSYNDGTPTVTYSYDPSIANGKGRLASVSSTVSMYNYEEFDALGRLKAGKQTTDGNVYTMSYSYDLAGHLTSEVYPSGRVVSNTFDVAGRLSSVTGQKPGQSNKTYSSNFSYTAHGAVAATLLGNGLWEHAGFNSRLQSTQIGLGTAGTNSNVLQLDYNYGSTNNNGNVQSQSITAPGAAAMTQSYSYDQLNRLQSAQETSGGNPSWQQAFTYLDQNGQNGRFGNRRIDAANTTSELISENPWFDPATNRIQPQAGEQYDYDAAGNLTKDKTGHTLAYDAENKQTIYAGGNPANGGAIYAYDGDGQRVKKVSSSGTTIFVYDAMGKLVAEYSDPQPAGGGTSYLTADNLGTPRVITDATGNVIGRHDYLPFGEEISSSYGGRSGVSGYAATDNVKQKFTLYERDNETGLDYAKARYYSAREGRFTSPDPFMGSGKTANPHSWNRYAYCANSPLVLIDPTGLDWGYYDLGNGQASVVWFDGKVGEYKGRQYAAVDFGKASSMVLTLSGGSQVEIFKSGGSDPLSRRSSPSSRRQSSASLQDDTLPEANQAVIGQAGHQPYEKAIGVFVVASGMQGYSLAASSLLLLDSAAAAAYIVHEQSESDAQVMASTGRAREVSGGQISEANVPDAALRYLGPGYREASPGRYVSADGMRQIRLGPHETRGPNLHIHFEAYDNPSFKGGRVVENAPVRIVPKR